ncbi:MAG: hypothetical protein N3C62_00155 [Synergistetes bacterium]|nr:hypothetical protein [Synergistota bacterium]MCX8127149.1 hypothetical protein [Synergistota bacterium]MDW8191965.1 hypothetical protein [Synergistota bacterium]
MLFLALSVEGALSPFLGPLTPDLAAVVVITSSCCLSSVKALLFAFLSGFLLDLRWEPVIGLSSIYFVSIAYPLSSLIRGSRFKLRYRSILIGLAILFLFQAFKFGFYRLLRLEYDVNFIIFFGRVIIDTLILGMGLILMRLSGGTKV